jgi:ribosomal protein L35AE/L33A
VFASGQQLEHWTYLFLGRPDTVIQSSAVRPGQFFTYAAGKHISRPGRTLVTVEETPHSTGVSIVNAILDWSSPSTGYIGSGTYTLIVERRGTTTIRYQAEKVVVKLPRAGPSRANPVVRRSEDCRGDLNS